MYLRPLLLKAKKRVARVTLNGGVRCHRSHFLVMLFARFRRSAESLVNSTILMAMCPEQSRSGNATGDREKADDRAARALVDRESLTIIISPLIFIVYRSLKDIFSFMLQVYRVLLMKKKKDEGKKIPGTGMDSEKLAAILAAQNFSNEQEVFDFMNKLVSGKTEMVWEAEDETQDNKFKAMDLIAEAYHLPPAQGKKLIKEALKLDPGNADAHTYLADIETDIEKAISLYRRAVEVGKKSLGAVAFEDYRGHFWGFHETRPYMRAMAGLADCLYNDNQVEEALALWQEMILLNPNDNQGVRYRLSTALLEKGRLEESEPLFETYADDATAHWAFNRALYLFMAEGKSKKAKSALAKAHKINPYVLSYMLGEAEMPTILPQYRGFGDPNEAILYAADSILLWANTPGAIEWITTYYLSLK